MPAVPSAATCVADSTFRLLVVRPSCTWLVLSVWIWATVRPLICAVPSATRSVVLMFCTALVLSAPICAALRYESWVVDRAFSWSEDSVA